MTRTTYSAILEAVDDARNDDRYLPVADDAALSLITVILEGLNAGGDPTVAAITEAERWQSDYPHCVDVYGLDESAVSS